MTIPVYRASGSGFGSRIYDVIRTDNKNYIGRFELGVDLIHIIKLFDAGQRVLEGVQGIQAVSAETVMIQLNLPDDQFLRKLASPYLVIYPREAVENNRAGLGRNPIGAGDYSLSRMEEGQLTLLRRERGNGGDVGRQPPVNRINLRYFEDETELMQHFAAGEIDWIPEAGPREWPVQEWSTCAWDLYRKGTRFAICPPLLVFPRVFSSSLRGFREVRNGHLLSRQRSFWLELRSYRES